MTVQLADGQERPPRGGLPRLGWRRRLPLPRNFVDEISKDGCRQTQAILFLQNFFLRLEILLCVQIGCRLFLMQ